MDIEQELSFLNSKDKYLDQCKYLTRRLKRKSTAIEAVTNFIEPNAISEQPIGKKRIKRSIPSFVNPLILIDYLNFVFQLILSCTFLYVLISLLLFVKNDIQLKIKDRRKSLEQLIGETKRNYVLNRCDPRTRVPAMEGQCNSWEVIMNRKIDSVEVTKIVIEVLAEAVDVFSSRLSIRTCLKMAGFLVLYLIFRNKKGHQR